MLSKLWEKWLKVITNTRLTPHLASNHTLYVNILSCKGECIILEGGAQTKPSKQPLLGSTAQLAQASPRALGAPSGYFLMKETAAAPSSCQGIREQRYWGNIQVLLSLNRRRGWEWEEFCSPAHSFCFPAFLSAAATSRVWRSDRQLTKLAHLAFINGHNHKAPRTWARWKERLSNTGKQKHLHTKPLSFLGRV